MCEGTDRSFDKGVELGPLRRAHSLKTARSNKSPSPESSQPGLSRRVRHCGCCRRWPGH
jgi:hypothetical protein